MIIVHCFGPLTGSFTQPDSLVPEPMNPAAWNRFRYVYGNPVNYSDPSGHFGWDVTLDVASFAWSAYDFYNDPSWANAGWLALDAVGLLPLIPAVGAVHHAGLADNAVRGASGLVPMTRGAGTIGPGHTGLSIPEAAMVATNPGTAVFLRNRATTSRDLELLWIAKMPDDENIIKFSNGGRVVKTGYGEGKYALRVSDLDIAFGVKFTKNGPRRMTNKEMIAWGNRFNEAYGINLVTHGDLVSGLKSRIPEIAGHARNVPRNDWVWGYTSGSRLGSGSLDQMYEFIFSKPLP